MAKNIFQKPPTYPRIEQSADSMAMELLKIPNYDVREALMSGHFRSVIVTNTIRPAVEKQCNFTSYPFKKSWLNDDDLKFAGNRDERLKKKKTH